MSRQGSSSRPREANSNGSATEFAEPWGPEELAATLDSAGTGIWAVDMEGCCVFINQAALRIFGYSREECLGRNIQCRVQHNDIEGWHCPVQNCRIHSALENGSAAWVDDDVFQRRDGTSFPVQYSVQPVMVRGQMRGAVISMQDVSARKSADEALRNRYEFLDFAEKMGMVGRYDLNLETGEGAASQGMFRLYGLDPSGKWPSHEEWRKLVHPVDLERINLELESVISGDQLPGTEFRIYWPDGSMHWIFGQSKVTFDEAGRATRLIGVNFDITSRVRAEAVLDQFFSASPTPLAIWGFDGRILRANPAWTTVLGYTPGELEGTPGLDLVHPEERAVAAAEFEALCVSGKRTGFECRCRCHDGSYRWLLMNASTVEDSHLIYATAEDITHRKMAEDALRQSEARFRSAFENTLFGMSITALDGRFLQANQSLCRMTGYSEQELQERTFATISHPDDRQESLDLWHALTNGSAASGTTSKRYLRPDGECLWVRVHVALVRDSLGEPLHFISMIEDLTEQKRAEAKARRSEESLGFSLDATGVGLYHEESGETCASEQQFRLYGLEPAQSWLTRERWLELVHPGDRERIDIEQRHATEQGEPYDLQFRVVWPDGSVRWLLCKGKIVQDDRGTRKLAVTVDITARRRAEAALEAFFCLSSSPKCIFDFNGSVRRTNAALVQASGFTTEEFAQRPIIEFFHPDDRAAIQAEFQRLITRGGHTEFEGRGLCKDGSSVWLYFSATAAPDEKLIFTVGYDISERKRMEKALQLNLQKLARSNHDLERFAYVASHDLQEPLRMVASFTQLLSKRYTGRLDETADRYIHYAADGAKRMQQLIADLLSYSRVNSRELDRREIDCEGVVKEAMRNLQAAIETSGAAIEWDPLPALSVDRAQFLQLFQNLLGNGIKFKRRDEPPHIHISAEDSGAEWLFSVQDNGIGIEPQHADRIFQIFQRLHTKEEFAGTGIGLAICKSVVERHGGKIWMESVPRVGSTFRFTIPKVSTSA